MTHALLTERRKHFIPSPMLRILRIQCLMYSIDCSASFTACRKRLFTINNFMDHVADDVLPGIVNKLSTS